MTTDDSTDWEPVNAHLDHGTGFIAAGVADALERHFGVFPEFGCAGGCVNMILRLETGHIVDITDITAPLTPIPERRRADGFTVAVYTATGFGYGDDPLIMLSEPADAEDLPDLIARTLTALTARRNPERPSGTR